MSEPAPSGRRHPAGPTGPVRRGPQSPPAAHEKGPKVQDSVAENVAGGDISKGNVIHNYYYEAPSDPPAAAPPAQPVYQQPIPQFPPQAQYPVQLITPTPLFNLDAPGADAMVYAVWLFFGLVGGHRMLLGDWGMGIVYFFTFGLFFIGWIGDFGKLPEMIENARQVQRQANH